MYSSIKEFRMASFRQTLLKDVRVLDASRVLAGPFCGQLLGDLGAEVIKVERPGTGDDTRAWGPPFFGSFSAYYLSCNRNKRSLALDLSQTAGQQLFYELVKRSDIVLENFRPDSADRLGLSPEKLHAVNSRLIVCSISGFGRTGPLREVPGYDFAIQSLSGLMSITGPVEGPPYKVGVAVTDVLTGHYAASAVLACLHARQQSGHGYAIDLALLDCALASQVNVAQAYLSTKTVPKRQGNAHLQIVPYQVFRTADEWLVLAIGNDNQWQRFCQITNRPDLANDARFTTNSLRVQHRQAVIPLLEDLFQERTLSEWEQLLQAHQIPHAPVMNYAQVFAFEQVLERGMKVTISDPEGQPVDLLGSPYQVSQNDREEPTMPPHLGQHTTEILRDTLGIDENQIEAWKANGVVG